MRIHMSAVLQFIVLILTWDHSEGICNLCHSGNPIACHNETAYSLCQDGVPTYDLIICPYDYVCTSQSNVCYSRETANPFCPDEIENGLCGVCNDAKVFSCIDKTTIAFCFGNDTPDYIAIGYCTGNTVCDLNNNQFCSDRSKVEPSCKIEKFETTETPIVEKLTTTTAITRPTPVTVDRTTTTTNKVKEPTAATKATTANTTERPTTTACTTVDTTATATTATTTNKPTTSTKTEKTTTASTTTMEPTTTTEKTTPTAATTAATTRTTTATTSTVEPTTAKTTAEPTTIATTTTDPTRTTTIANPTTIARTEKITRASTTTNEPTTTTTTTTEALTTTTTTSATTTTTSSPVTVKIRNTQQLCGEMKTNEFYKADGDATCKKYILCYERNGSWAGILKKCTTGLYFNEDQHKCSPEKPNGCA